jgi:hypothetical protein
MLEEIPLTAEHVFSMDVQAAPPVELGARGQGLRRMIPIVGGTVRGPRLSGRILPGADWQVVHGDGLTILEAHHPIEADDGARIEFVNRGVRNASPEIARRLSAGEEVDPRSYYFRSAASFSAPAGPHAWLNGALFVGIGARLPQGVTIRFFKIS